MCTWLLWSARDGDVRESGDDETVLTRRGADQDGEPTRDCIAWLTVWVGSVAVEMQAPAGPCLGVE